MLVDEAFDILACVVRRHHGAVFIMDRGGDAYGHNRRTNSFCRVVDSSFDHDLCGKHLYCNHDFIIIHGVLDWFLGCYGRAAPGTSGTFVLLWMYQSFW